MGQERLEQLARHLTAQTEPPADLQRAVRRLFDLHPQGLGHLLRYHCRHPLATAVTSGLGVLFMLPGEEPRRWADVDPAAVSQFWAELATPIAGAELCARLQGRPSAVERFLSALLDSPLVVSGTL